MILHWPAITYAKSLFMFKKLLTINYLKSFLLACVTMASVSVYAQSNGPNISDDELKNFGNAYTEIQALNQKMQAKMGQAVQASGMEVQRFTEIQKISQDPNQELSMTDDEKKSYTKANEALKKIQTSAQQDMQTVITNNDLTVQRFQTLSREIQSSPELQQKMQQQQNN